MDYTHVLPNVGTSEGPSWTVHDGKEIWMAWKGQGSDTAIYIASTQTVQAKPDPTTGTYTFSPQVKLADAGTSTSPTIASSQGVLYLFWKGEHDNVISWSMCSDGKTWKNQGPLVIGPGSLSDSSNKKNAETSHAPAAVATKGGLNLFYKAATSNEIWMAIWESNFWNSLQVTSSTGGVPLTDDSPAAAAHGDTIHLVWKGNDNNLLWSMLGPQSGGIWSEQERVFGPAAYAPALTVDGNNVVWLVWVNAPYADLNMPWAHTGDPFASPQLCFSSLGAANKWSPSATRLGIVPGSRPTLISTAPPLLCF
jgi:hypothetical protein